MKKTLCYSPKYTIHFEEWSSVPLVMNMKECCCLLRKTEVTVRKMITSGLIRGRKSGGEWYIDRESVRAFLTG